MKETFDKIVMDEEKKAEMRYALSTKKAKRKVWLAPVLGLAAAAILLMAIPTTRTAIVSAAERLLRTQYNSKSGLQLNFYADDETEDPNENVSVNGMDTFKDLIEVKGDRMYLVVDNQLIDVTDLCSEDDYYLYECTDADGTRHMIYVGGTLENHGWLEYIYPANDDSMICSTSNVGSQVQQPWKAKVYTDRGEA